jgi:hypothetical protein
MDLVAMDLAVLKALKEKRELERRLAEIDQFLRLYREFSGESMVNESAHDRENESVHDLGYESLRNRAVRGLTPRGPKAVARFSETILREASQPLTRGQIASELEVRGVELKGGDRETRARYVGTILWRYRNVFENIEGKGYWLKDVLIPETEPERKALRDGHRIIED